jgi:hypothetical protein
MFGESTVFSEVIVKILANLLDHILPSRARLVYFEVEPVFAVLGRQQINTHTVIIQNSGRKGVENIRIIHNWPPGAFQHNVMPVRACHTMTMSTGQFAFAIDFIRPRECIFITYIYGTPLPQRLLHSIATSEREAEKVNFPVVNRYPTWVHALIGVLALIGASFGLYYLIKGFGHAWHFISQHV